MLLNKFIKSLLRPPNNQLLRYCSTEQPKALRSLKAKSTRNTVQYYVDACRVRAVAGNGGDGCISFLSAWCKDHAGPDGGDGGHGGHVIFQATHSVKSLNHCRSVIMAKHGEKGYNKDCCGKNAQHVVVPVPLGTIVKDSQGRVVGDLSAEGTMFVAARGGAGGRGNKFFLTDTEQAPDVAEIGATGETLSYSLEVRSMAHVGLLGFPNAGKSTLLRAVTRARPIVAPYPFTTLRPHVGMIPYDDYEQVALADLPGLIPGSHKNYGLGIQFLQHVERCRGLIYFLDGTDQPQRQLENLSYELTQYSSTLAGKPSCVVVNKIDLPEGRKGYEKMKQWVQQNGDEIFRRKRNDEENSDDDEIEAKDRYSSTDDHNIHEEIEGSYNENNLSKTLEGSPSKSLNKINNDRNVDTIDNIDVRSKRDEDINSTDAHGSERDVNYLDSRNKKDVAHRSEGDSDIDSDIRVREIFASGGDIVIGVSAKTGQNLGALLRVIREMYNRGDT